MTLLNRKKIFSLFTISSSVFLSGCFNFSCAVGATNNGGGSDQKILNNSIAITALEDNTTVEVKLNGNCRPDLWYSYFGDHWDSYKYDKPFTLNKNQILYLRGMNENGWSKSADKYANFSFNKAIDLAGNLKNLINYDLESDKNCPITDYCFYKLFDSCPIAYLSIDLLSSFDIMKDHCFSQMFSKSTIPYIPNLVATVSANYCYEQMFSNCLSLEKIESDSTNNFHNFSFLSEGCFQQMFAGCKNLEKFAGQIKANSIPKYACDSMFSDCEKLTNSPTIIVGKDYEEYCFQKMFYNCQSLTTPFGGIKFSDRFISQFKQGKCDKCFYQTFAGCKSLCVSEDQYPGKRNFDLITIPTDIDLSSANPFSQMFAGCSVSNFSSKTFEVVPGKTYYYYYL